jgi:hypothetical protein
MEPTLTIEEARELAWSLRDSGRDLRFTNLANKNMVKKLCTQMGFRTVSRTAHGSLLDPRYTVEGRMLPDKGLGNDYKHYHPKLYCLERERW